MSDYFGDASYWLALVDEKDQYHEIATQYSALLELENARVVTSQLVLNDHAYPVCHREERSDVAISLPWRRSLP